MAIASASTPGTAQQRPFAAGQTNKQETTGEGPTGAVHLGKAVYQMVKDSPGSEGSMGGERFNGW